MHFVGQDFCSAGGRHGNLAGRLGADLNQASHDQPVFRWLVGLSSLTRRLVRLESLTYSLSLSTTRESSGRDGQNLFVVFVSQIGCLWCQGILASTLDATLHVVLLSQESVFIESLLLSWLIEELKDVSTGGPHWPLGWATATGAAFHGVESLYPKA